ncbi:MAG: hypothetical protein KAS95_02950 [Candidatus Heimdallarchaeota archaeon]|nr:hypothetical protein [Candidatus Heimdallarchaeota archaeon]
MKVYHIMNKELVPQKEPYKFLNGDVYIVETDQTLWIWIGSKSYADDKAVGAWGAKVVEEQNKNLKIKTIMEGDEPEEFNSFIDYEVVVGDTPGFLVHFKKKHQKDFQLLKIEQDETGKLTIKEAPIEYKAFESENSFVLDAYDEIYVWIGKDSQVREKYEAGKISRILDTERKRKPLIYTIEEEQEPEGFRSLVYKIALKDGMMELRRTVDKKEEKKKKWWQFWK